MERDKLEVVTASPPSAAELAESAEQLLELVRALPPVGSEAALEDGVRERGHLRLVRDDERVL